ncbi:sugar phosphate isomerase/epimerase family protein [Paenibacillus glycinis]|uniref:TIM barrel protein n=1 Tax=Paenibacillus glycinis TaxID=2697035 RepID=A0ABW9XUH6_9BACL|nr:TIM barrel protein [Paenibacillus glycinis]NBD26308.1 TIM barrel protein [Paenibacillus glycinis]
MKLGMPTLVEFKRLEQNVELCRELQLDFVELNMNLPICIPENLDPTHLRAITEETGIAFTLHLPEELDLASFQPRIRQGHMACCIEAMDWASLAGIGTLNMHVNNGIYFTLPDGREWINAAYETEFIALLLDSYRALYRHAERRGIRLCIENTCNFQLPFIRHALDRLAAFDNFCLTWDTGHDAKTGFREEPALLAHAGRIRHMHLHDCRAQSDHQTLYSGDVPIHRRLDFAQAHGISAVIEVKTGEALRESVRRLRERYPLNAGS